MDTEFFDAKKSALRLLGFRARSTAEMRERLARKKIKAEVIGRVIESLEKEGFLNDAAFARQMVTSRMSARPQAKRVMEWELKKKGLGKEAMAEAADEMAAYDERSAAEELCRARLAGMRNLTGQKKKERLFGLLKRRGYSNDVVYGVLNTLFKNDEPITE